MRPLPQDAFYADAAHGDDANPGSQARPFQTVPRGLAACRAASGGGCTLVLRDSAPFVLDSTQELTPADSGLTLTAFPGEAPVLTGAAPLPSGTVWQPFNVTGGANVWVARGLALPSPPGALFVNGTRAVRARWPNCDPETCAVPDGYANASGWLPPVPPAAPPTVVKGNFSRGFDVFFPDYTWATGGAATQRFEPPEGYWIHPRPPGGTTWAVPGGFTYDPSRFSPRAAGWANPTTGFVHAFHGEYWGNWAFPIAAHNSSRGEVVFGPGGWQEARGWGYGGALYVENVFEELDAPGEWFWDASTGDLFLWHDAPPGTPPPAGTGTGEGGVSTAVLETLLSLQGTPTAPVTGVSLLGLTLTGSQPTFLTRLFRAPSGGDWSFADTAAVVAGGTAGLLVDACTFDRLGGNGLLLRGWNRGATVNGSTFTRLGDSAIVAAGWAQGQDLAALNVPVGTTVTGCAFSRVGMFVKQSGALYTALTANTTFTRNVAWDLPRAAVNINDGAFGGHTVSENLLFNCVTETSDHGCINTWDREPYAQPGRVNPDGSPVLLPSTIAMTGNFLINSHYAIHPLDHDDGSNAILDTGNVLAFAGTKNFQGFDKVSVGNLVVRPDYAPSGTPAGVWRAPGVKVNSFGQSVTPDGVPLPGAYYFPACARSVGQAAWGPARADVFANNTCVLGSVTDPYLYQDCNPAAPGGDGQVPLASGNTYMTPGGAYALACGGKTLSLGAAQAAGYDVGSTVSNSSGLSPAGVAELIATWLRPAQTQA